MFVKVSQEMHDTTDCAPEAATASTLSGVFVIKAMGANAFFSSLYT